jgi:hypothetical protein
MAEVFAGFVAGYLLALLSTPFFAVLMFRLRARSELLRRLLPAESNVVAVAMLLHGGLTLTLTAVGIVLGLILLAMEDGEAGAGSLNWPYTLLVAAMILAIVAPVFAVVRPLRRVIATGALLGLAVFGWLMPYLADWSKFDS